MKRRILAVIVTLATAFTLSLSVFAISDDIDWAAQNRATDTYQVIYNAVYDKNNRPMRDDFAGAWYDQSTKKLVVAVTEDGDMNFYRELTKDYDNIELTTLKYSLKALRILQDEVFHALIDIMSSAGVYETENFVAFGVRIDADEARPQVLQAMTEAKDKYGFPDGIENAFTVEYEIIGPLEGWDDDTVSVDAPQECRAAPVTDETV